MTSSSPDEPVSAMAARPSEVEVAVLRDRVVRSLEAQGFRLTGEGLLTEPPAGKDAVRGLHSRATAARNARAAKPLRRHEDRLLSHFAAGSEVDVQGICPVLRLVTPGSQEELLFRYARLHWSVPVSAGYGRRLRFLVLDRQNDKLIGLIGLGDPVMRMGPRDAWVGWDAEAIRHRLRHVMDAFVLGAAPPYNRLLCGKLVAMLAASVEVRQAFKARYAGSYGLISGAPFNGDLAMITTQSALGRSSIYNRLGIPGGPAFVRAGETRGSGEFHFSDGVYDEVLDFARRYVTPTAKNAAWGAGFRNKREVVRSVLRLLDLNPDLVYHGVKREVYCVPLARNTREFLRGDEETLDFWPQDSDDITIWFRERWLLPRASRIDDWRRFDPESLRIWREA